MPEFPEIFKIMGGLRKLLTFRLDKKIEISVYNFSFKPTKRFMVGNIMTCKY